RVEALPDILQFASGRFGALEIQPVQPFADQPANRVIVRGRKGTRKPISLLPGLVIHQADLAYRPEIKKILSSPSGLYADD
ncbi:MAG: methyltransferase, partial [Pseudomonadota bacterium]